MATFSQLSRVWGQWQTGAYIQWDAVVEFLAWVRTPLEATDEWNAGTAWMVLTSLEILFGSDILDQWATQPLLSQHFTQQQLRDLLSTIIDEQDRGAGSIQQSATPDAPNSPWIYPGEGIDPQIASG